MIYLIDPAETIKGACPKKCATLCSILCAVKPLYGVPI